MASATRSKTADASRPREEDVKEGYGKWKAVSWEDKASDYYTKLKEVLGDDFKMDEKRPIILAFRKLRQGDLTAQERSKVKIELWKSFNRVWINHTDMAEDKKRDLATQVESASTSQDTLKTWRSGVAIVAEKEQTVSKDLGIDQREYDSYRETVVKIHDNGKGNHLGEEAEKNAHAYWILWDNMYGNYMVGRPRAPAGTARTTPPPPVEETDRTTRSTAPPPLPPHVITIPSADGGRRKWKRWVAAGVLGAALVAGTVWKGDKVIDWLNATPAQTSQVTSRPAQGIALRGAGSGQEEQPQPTIKNYYYYQTPAQAPMQQAANNQSNKAQPQAQQQASAYSYPAPAVNYATPIAAAQAPAVYVVAPPCAYGFIQPQFYPGCFWYYGSYVGFGFNSGGYYQQNFWPGRGFVQNYNFGQRGQQERQTPAPVCRQRPIVVTPNPPVRNSGGCSYSHANNFTGGAPNRQRR